MAQNSPCVRGTFTPHSGLCTKNTSRALVERPYSCAPQAVGAVYDRPGFFVQSHLIPKTRNILYPSRKQRRQSGRRGAERNRATAPPAPHSINVRTEPAASSLGADGSR